MLDVALPHSHSTEHQTTHCMLYKSEDMLYTDPHFRLLEVTLLLLVRQRIRKFTNATK